MLQHLGMSAWVDKQSKCMPGAGAMTLQKPAPNDMRLHSGTVTLHACATSSNIAKNSQSDLSPPLPVLSELSP